MTLLNIIRIGCKARVFCMNTIKRIHSRTSENGLCFFTCNVRYICKFLSFFSQKSSMLMIAKR